MELEGIEAAITAPNVILHYGWQDMPINNIQQFRVRFSFVNQSSVNGEPFKYSDKLRQVSQITLAVDSQSENWTKGVTFPSSGKWVRMNNSGRIFRFTGGEIDLNIELYTASAQ